MGRTAEKQAVAMDLLPHLRQAHDHIDRHYASPIGLDELARVAGVSKYHFARCFEAAYGMTPIRYLTRRRVERAQDLLRHANLTVTETCFLVGFSSLGSFSSLFTRLVGESPTAYRDRWAARGGPHVPGCYLFMRGPGQLGATAGSPATATAGTAGNATAHSPATATATAGTAGNATARSPVSATAGTAANATAGSLATAAANVAGGTMGQGI